jgi:hypothetical protein
MKNKAENLVSMILVGDVLIQREDPESTFTKTPSIFEADILWGNLEGIMSDAGEMLPWSGHNFHHMDLKMMSGLNGFHVVSLANNHTMDFGPKALIECMDTLSKKKIAYSGAGKNIAEARRPAILERKGTRIAFLAYSSVGVDGPLPYAAVIADSDRPGMAAVRVSPLYAAPQVNPHDMEKMKEDIKNAKTSADVVVVSHHWGESCSHATTPHQWAIGHESIEAGADLVIGAHPHMLQGIEIYKDKVICYSLGAFAYDRAGELRKWEFPLEMGHGIIKCVISDKEIQNISFIPTLVGEGQTQHRHPEIVTVDDPEGRKVFELMDKLSKELGTNLTIEDGEIAVFKKR